MDTSCKPVSSTTSCLLGNGLWEYYPCITFKRCIETMKEAPLHLNQQSIELVYHSLNAHAEIIRTAP